MKVILLEEVKGKGGEGDVVDVAHGFAVNYLLPRRKAIEATKGNLKQLEARKGNIAKRELARTTDAKTLHDAIDGKTVTIPAKIGEEGQLFGSITAPAIVDAIAAQLGVTIDRKKIDLGQVIKTAGLHTARVAIYRDIKATVDIDVTNIDATPVADAAPAAEAVVESVQETVESAAE